MHTLALYSILHILLRKKPVITLLLLTLAALVGTAMLMFLRNLGSKSAADKRIEDIKLRAAERANKRAFADTESESDPYRTSLDLSLAMTSVEVCDLYDGRGPLTDEQIHTIGLIGTDLGHVETIVVDDAWNNKYNRA